MHHHCERPWTFWWAICNTDFFRSKALVLLVAILSLSLSLLSHFRCQAQWCFKETWEKVCHRSICCQGLMTFTYWMFSCLFSMSMVSHDILHWLFSGTNWERADWCSRRYILWHCGVHYRYMDWCKTLPSVVF